MCVCARACRITTKGEMPTGLGYGVRGVSGCLQCKTILLARRFVCARCVDIIIQHFACARTHALSHTRTHARFCSCRRAWGFGVIFPGQSGCWCVNVNSISGAIYHTSSSSAGMFGMFVHFYACAVCLRAQHFCLITCYMCNTCVCVPTHSRTRRCAVALTSSAYVCSSIYVCALESGLSAIRIFTHIHADIYYG